jgi:hyperosmotically inducible protein
MSLIPIANRILSVLVMLALACTLVLPASAQSNQKSDDKIYDLIRQKLANDPDVKGAGFEVTVKDGAVTLNGDVHDEKAREKAEKLTKKIKGVTSVNNQLKVTGA